MKNWYNKEGKVTRSHPFVRQYVITMLWSSNDETDEYGGDPLDEHYDPSDLSDCAWAKVIEDCNKFWSDNYDDLTEENVLVPGCPLERGGHDFWLTRNGHGAGFWDGDWEDPAATRLSESAKEFGEQYPYVYALKESHAKIYLS